MTDINTQFSKQELELEGEGTPPTLKSGKSTEPCSIAATPTGTGVTTALNVNILRKNVESIMREPIDLAPAEKVRFHSNLHLCAQACIGQTTTFESPELMVVS